jgi:cytochrome c oxidase subunit 1
MLQIGDLMTTEASPLGALAARRPFPARLGPKGSLIYKLVTTTDHKTIGIMYIVACFATFFTAGLMALLMRAELAQPGLQFLSNEQYNQLFTMHGTIAIDAVDLLLDPGGYDFHLPCS